MTLDRLTQRMQRWSTSIMMREAYARLPTRDIEVLSRNAKFANAHRGERAFVIGNGPSIQEQDLTLLADEHTFAVNAFWKHPINEQWQPSYYFVTDGVFYDGGESSRSFFAQMAEHVTKSTFFAPVQFANLIADGELLPEASTHYLAIDAQLATAPVDRIDLTRVVPSPTTVLQTALLAAIAMGCSPIYVIGADHSWLQTIDEAIDPHFYEGKTLQHLADDVKNNPHRRDYLGTMDYVRSVWLGHVAVRRLALSAGLEVYNATAGGLLDVYPRRAYEDLF